jgi:hypothetical protein
MADVIPPWLQGFDLTAVRIQGGTRAGDGTLTKGAVSGTSDFVITNSVMAVRLTGGVQRADLRPVNRRAINEVITGEGLSIRLVELLKRDESVLKNTVPLLAYTFDYVYLTVTRGPNSWKHWFVRGNVVDGVDNFAGNTAEWELGPCDPGTAPAYSTP